VGTRAKPFYGWWVLLSASTVLMTAFSMSAYALPVFYPELVRVFGWPRASVALGGSFKTLLIGLVAPLNGWIIDRKGVRTILLAGLVTVGTAYALLSGIHSLWAYFLICFLLGTGGSWIHHLPNQLLVASWFAKKRGMAIGIMQMLGGIGDSLIPLLTAFLIKNFGWREALIGLPVILIAPLLAVMFVVRNKPQDMGLYPDGLPGPSSEPAAATPQAPSRQAHSKTHLTSADAGWDTAMFKTTRFWMISLLFLLIGWSTFSVWQHFVLFLRDQGFSPGVAASMFSLFLASSTVSRFICGPLSDKTSADFAMLLNLVCIALSLMVLVATRNHAAIYLAMVVFGLGYGGGITCRPLLVFAHFGDTGVGKLYGVTTALFTTGAFFGPAVAGRIFDKTGNYHLSFILALILAGVSIVILILLGHSKSNQAS